MEEPKKTAAIKSTETVKKVRSIVRGLYTKAMEAKEAGIPVAYTMTLGCYDEILRAMDIVPIWTENYGALCAVKRDADRFLQRAQAEGFSDALCTYAMAGIGFDALREELGEMPPDAPDGGMPKPDLLITSSSMCEPHLKWYQALGRYMDTPLFNMDVIHFSVPITANISEVRDYHIKYQVDQYKRLIEFLERETGKKMDWDRLAETVDIGERTWRLWWETYELRKNRPCPMPSQDHFSVIVPAMYLTGLREALDFYQGLYDEIKYRVDNNISAIPNEKYRLLWAGGLPPWHTMQVFNFFEEHGAVCSMETVYRPPEPPEMPAGTTDPLGRLSWRYFDMANHRHVEARSGCGDPSVQLILDLIKDFGIDGMVMHVVQSCRATTIGQVHFANVVRQQVDVPTLFIESDMVNASAFSEVEVKKNIAAFVETLDARK